MRGLLLFLAGTVAAVPGFLTLRTGLISPPGYDTLFGATAEVVGVATLAIMLGFQRRIARLSTKRFIRITIILVILMIMAVGGFAFLRDTAVVSDSDRGAVMIPLFARDPELSRLINSAGSPYEALLAFGRDDLDQRAKRTPGALTATALLILLPYLSALASTVAVATAAASRVRPTELA